MALRDPYRNFKFEVEIGGFTRAGFRMVSGFKQTTEVIEYREGGENETPRKLPGQTTYENITLERGMSAEGGISSPGSLGSGGDMVNWAAQIFNLDSKDGQQPPGTDGASNQDFRRDVVCYLKNKSGVRVEKITIIRAWPTECEMGDLDASSNEVLIEKLVLANEGVRWEKLVVGAPLV